MAVDREGSLLLTLEREDGGLWVEMRENKKVWEKVRISFADMRKRQQKIEVQNKLLH